MANVIWKPTAAPRSEVISITIAGTPADTNTIGVTIAGQDLVMTLGATAITAADCADKLYRAINATSRTDNIEDDETRNIGGAEIPQLAELQATYPGTGAVLYLTGPPGVDIGAITTPVTGGGATATPAVVQAATGPNFWDNADNWAGGAVPVNDDTVFFYDSATDCLYGLPTGTLTVTAIHVQASYTGRIGLPPVNRHTPTAPYPEYRARYVDVGNAVGGAEFLVGEGVGNGPRLVNVDNSGSAVAAQYRVFGTGARLSADQYVVNMKTSTALSGNEIAVNSGSAAFNHEAGDTGEVHQVFVNGAGADVWLGGGFSNDDIVVVQYDGNLLIGDLINTLRMFGGTATVAQGFNGSSGELWVLSGALCRLYEGQGMGSLAKVRISGTLDATLLTDVHTLAICEAYRGFVILDPNRRLTYSTGIDFVGCGPNDGIWNIRNITLTPTDI